MLYMHFSKEILGLQEAEKTEISIELPRKECVCPSCGDKTDKIHDKGANT